MRGRDKLLEDVDDLPLLRRQSIAAIAADLPVLVTLPPDNMERAAALEGTGVETRTVTDADKGMSGSLRESSIWAQELSADGLLVLLPDLPDLTTPDILTVCRAFLEDPDTPCRATDSDGKAGHPVLLPARLFDQLTQLTGDQGANAILRSEPIHAVPLPGQRATVDLDTPEAWAAWRAKRTP
jgi:CTP:molybdopterin cytidylyltransferase MocA